MRGRETFVRERIFSSAQRQQASVGRSPEANTVRAKGSRLPLIKILRALIFEEHPIFPMESPTKWVSIGSDEQRNERAFGMLAGSETMELVRS